MILLFFTLLNVCVVFYFFYFQKKNLHSLEVFMYWLISTILFQNYSALFHMNIGRFKIPDIPPVEFSHLLNRLVLVPVVTLIFLNIFISLNRILKVFICLVFFMIFCGVEGLEHALGILIHTNWNISWSIGFWILYILLNVLFMKFFRKKLLNEVPVS